MPTVVYRALYQPAVVTAYQPVIGCNTCSGYAVAAYRPAYPWAYQGRLVPYATYMPVYTAAPVAAYASCNSCASYSPCTSCNSCASCSSCGGGGTVTYGAPAPACASCTAPPVTAPPTIVTPAPNAGYQAAPPAAYPQGAAPPRTFQERTEMPATEPEIKPIPQTDTHLNSMPAPLLPDPRDRTAAQPAYPSARVAMVASPIQVAPLQDSDGWQAANK